jgi:hypothetical protein
MTTISNLDNNTGHSVLAIFFVGVILLSLTNKNYIKFAFDNMVGRLLLIGIIIGLTYFNTLAGIMATAVLLIAFNTLPIKNDDKAEIYLGITKNSTEPIPNTAAPKLNTQDTPSLYIDIADAPNSKLEDAATNNPTYELSETQVQFEELTNDFSESFVNMGKNNYLDMLTAEEVVRSKSSKTLNFPNFGKPSLHEPEANWPDKEGFVDQIGSLIK